MDIQKIEKRIKTSHIFLAALGIFSCSVFLFYPSLNYYFFQDDWFVLNWVRSSDVQSFFQFRTDIIYWRPISMPFFFWIGDAIFGLKPFGFHLLTFALHFANSIFLGYIAFLLFRSKISALIIAFLYATASFHFMSLSWLSLSWNHIGNFFLTLALIFFIKAKPDRRLMILISFMFFLLALLSTEFALIFPALLVFIELFRTRFDLSESLRRNLLPITTSVLLIFTYLIARFILFPIPSEGDYAVIFDSRVPNTLFWYLLWLVNVPEVLKYHVLISNLSFSNDPTFLNPFKPFLFPLAISFIAFILASTFLFLKISRKIIFKPAVTTLTLFFLSLIPVLFLPSHSFPYYLSVASISFFILIGYVVSSAVKNNLNPLSVLSILFFLVGWILTSYLNLSFTYKTHWIAGEQSISKKAVEKVQRENQFGHEADTIILTDSSDQLLQSLMDQNAMQVIYNNHDIKTVYK